MMIGLRDVTRIVCQIGKIALTALLVTWIAAAPLVWILRDGLAPGMIETVGAQAAYKFLIGWGVPALILAVPLMGLAIIERRCQSRHAPCEADDPYPEC